MKAPSQTIEKRRFRLIARLGFGAALIALCLVLAYPFLSSITWAIALAIIAWPMHKWVSRWIAHRSLAAGLSTTGVTVAIILPTVFVVYQLAQSAGQAADQIADRVESGLMKSTADIPGANHALNWVRRLGVDVEQAVRSLIEKYTQDIARLAQGSFSSAIQFLVAIFILYYLLKEPGAFRERARQSLPLTTRESERLFKDVADSVHANLHATVITSVLDAGIGGLVFWLVGLPAPLLWAVVMFILALLPILGAALVWMPAVMFLALSGRWLGAFAVLSWGILTFLIVDNYLYVKLAGKRMRMHPVIALVAFLGGIAVFGLAGMVLGPVIFAVTASTLEIFRARKREPALESN